MPRLAHDTGDGRQRTSDVRQTNAGGEDDDNAGIGFVDMLLSAPTLAGLRGAGFARPSPVQLAAIPLATFGSDVIAQAKNGTGKTCVYAVAALEQLQLERAVPQVLVLAPTRELAQQSAHVICEVGSAHGGLQCHCFIGGTPLRHDRQALEACHVVVGTPGRVAGLVAEGVLRVESLRLLVFDEADKLLQPDFQADIGTIVDALPPRRQTLSLSATYSSHQIAQLRRWMRDPQVLRVGAEGRSLRGVEQRYCLVAPLADARLPAELALHAAKVQRLLRLLDSLRFCQCIIYLNHRSLAHELVRTLADAGFPAVLTAGDLPQEQRTRAMELLRGFSARVLVSTDLTARGVDVESVDLVVNLDIPTATATYVHRVGRTGRFGTRGTALSLVSASELLTLQRLARQLQIPVANLDAEAVALPAVGAEDALADADRTSYSRLAAMRATALSADEDVDSVALELHLARMQPAEPAPAPSEQPDPAAQVRDWLAYCAWYYGTTAW